MHLKLASRHFQILISLHVRLDVNGVFSLKVTYGGDEGEERFDFHL
jgi:hypothetical protein